MKLENSLVAVESYSPCDIELPERDKNGMVNSEHHYIWSPLRDKNSIPKPDYLKILEQGVEHWNQWREEHPEEEPDLSMAILHKADLAEANFRAVNLSRANLSMANLRRANFREANLRGANLFNASLREANLNEADLYLADLRETYLFGATLVGASLAGTTLRAADLRTADLHAVYLVEATLLEASLFGANLSRATLVRTDLCETDLRSADLSETNLTGAKLYMAKLVGTNLSRADITGVTLYGTARDDWSINGINCEYVFWDRDGEHRIPKDRDFRPGEFEELYKHLPTFDYYFKHGFTALDAVVMSRIVEAINEQHPEFELKLDSFHSRGQPHAKFTVLHKENIEDALNAIKADYEAKMKALEAERNLLDKFLTLAIKEPRTVIERLAITEEGELTMGDKRIAGHNYFEKVSGHAQVTTGDTFHDQAQKIINMTTSDISKEEIVKLLVQVQHELHQADDIPEETKEEALAEIKTAEVQVKKDKPDKPKLVDRLKNAKNVLSEIGGTSEKAVMVGHLLVKVIEWAEQLLT